MLCKDLLVSLIAINFGKQFRRILRPSYLQQLGSASSEKFHSEIS